MKIALFYNLPSGGAKRAVYEWTRRLAARHTIDVFTMESADHDFCDIRPFAHSYTVFPFSTRRLFPSPFGRLNALQRTRDLHALAALHQQMAAQINAGGYDVLFAHSDKYTFIPILLQYAQIPSVYYLHEPFGRTYQPGYQRPYINPRPRQEVLNKIDPLLLLYKRTLNGHRWQGVQKTTRLLANSEFTRAHMRQAYGIETPVCNYGVDSENFHPEPAVRKENLVVSVGEMGPRKGFDFLVESLGLVPAPLRPHLELACNFVRQDELRFITEMAKARNVSLTVLTNQNSSQLRRLFNRAKLCVYSPYNEPLGLVPLEAMACGTPVLGVAEGGVKETVRHEETGVLTPRDPHQFAQALVDLLQNPERLNRLGSHARDYVLECWTWDGSVQKLEEHFAAVQGLQNQPAQD